MTNDKRALRGAEQIISKGLQLAENEQLLIFADETTVEVASVLAEAATRVEVQPTILFVPISIQIRTPEEIELSSLTLEAGRTAQVLLSCVNGSPACLPFRVSLIKSFQRLDRRCGTMPGATLDVLRMGDVNWDEVCRDCKTLELPLIRGRSLVLTSQALGGVEHRLRVDIGGWTRLPVASDGMIEKGVWGNTPSGETYIAPIEGTAQGSVVINGSIPDHVINPGGEIVLHFSNGMMVGMEPQDSPAALWLTDKQIDVARGAGDENWSYLAEIGIGVNPAVKRLTGNMLCDEKAAGTAHIAIGANEHMGGTIKSRIHCDMAIWKPSITIDDRPIVEHGRLVLQESDWRPNYRTVSPNRPLPGELVEFKRSVAQTKETEGGLERVLRQAPGRVSSCTIGDDETARIAATVYHSILGARWQTLETLAARTALDLTTVAQVVQILGDYELILSRSRKA